MDLSTKEADFSRLENSSFTLRFPLKLWRIIHENEGGAIQWSRDGSTILINYERLKEEHLSGAQNTFKTTNVASFIRQLNLYGFRKVSGHLRKLKGDDVRRYRQYDQKNHEFYNAYFLKGRPDLLAKITRKPISDKTPRIRKKTTSQETRQNMQRSRIAICQQALVNALACASGNEDVEQDETDSSTVPDYESEEINITEAWNNEVWLAANGSSATTAEALLKNINRSFLASNSFASVSHGGNQTGNTPPTEFIRKLHNPTEYDASNESNILGFGVEKEMWHIDRPTTWQIVENQLLEPLTERPISAAIIRENKENMMPRCIAQPIEIATFPYTPNFESNGETYAQSWSF